MSDWLKHVFWKAELHFRRLNTARPVGSIDHFNRTGLTTWSRLSKEEKISQSSTSSKEVQEQMRPKGNASLSVKGSNALWGLGTTSQGESHYPGGAGLPRTHPGGHGRPQNNIQRPAPLTGLRQGAWSRLNNVKDTSWESSKVTADLTEHKDSSHIGQKTSCWSTRLWGRLSVDGRDKSLSFWKVCVQLRWFRSGQRLCQREAVAWAESRRWSPQHPVGLQRPRLLHSDGHWSSLTASARLQLLPPKGGATSH